MTNKHLQLRRGTPAHHNSFTGASGEVTVNTTNKTVHVHDGATQGGIELARKDLSNALPSAAVSLNSQRLTNLAAPSANNDAATKQYVDEQLLGGGVALPFVGGVSLSSSTLSDISDASIVLFSSGELIDVEVSGDISLGTDGVVTVANSAITTDKLADGNVSNAKLENSSITVNGGTVSLGGSLTVQGTANEVSVDTAGSTITVGLPDAVTIAATLSVANVVISGNLTVSGTTTTVNTTEVLIADNILTLNSDLAAESAPTENAGIEVNRGSADTASLLWDEANDRWGVKVGAGTLNALRHAGVKIVTVDLEDAGVTNDKLAADSVNTTQLVDAAVTNSKLAGSITGDKLSDDTVASTKLADFNDTLSKTAGRVLAADGTLISSLPVGGDLSSSIVGGTLTFSLVSGVVSDAEIAEGAAIAGSKIADGSIQTGKIADSAITAAKLSTNSVTSDKIEGSAVTEGKIAAGAVTELKLGDSAVTANKIADGVVTNLKLVNSAITFSNNINASPITLGGTVKFVGDSNVGVAVSGATFSFSLAPTLSVKAGSLSNFDTDDLTEGGTNQYFTDVRARGAVSATDAGGDGSFSYDNATGVFTYTGPSATDVRAHFSAGGNISLTDGVIATAPTISADLIGNVTGQVSDISNFDTDDLAEGDTNLYFTAARAQQSISVTDVGGDGSLTYDNLTGVLTFTGPDATEVRAHFTAGSNITLTDGEIATTATLTADLTGDVTGTVSDISNHTTDSLSEGAINQYFTDTRARSAFSAGTNIVINAGEIATSPTLTADLIGNVTGQVSDISNFDTDDVAEGVGSLYFTTQRARDSFTAGANVTIVGGTISASASAATADALATAVTISISGAVSGSVEFDGSADVDIVVSIDDGSITNGKLENSSITLSDASSNDITASLGDQVFFKGTAGEVSVAASGATFTFSLPSNVSATTFTGAIATSSLVLSGSAVTSSAAELNLLDGSSAANDVAGKAAVVGTDGNLTVAGALVVNGAAGAEVNGNLLVSGEAGPIFSVLTQSDSVTVNTAALSVEDSLVLLNNNNLANADVGIYGKVSGSDYASIAYDRSTDTWKVGVTTAPTSGNVLPFPATLGSLSAFQAGSIDTASLTVGTLDYPAAPGTSGQVLKMVGGTLSFGSVSASAAPAFSVETGSATLSAGTGETQTVILRTATAGSYTLTLPAAEDVPAGYTVTVVNGSNMGVELSVAVNDAVSEVIVDRDYLADDAASKSVFTAATLRVVSDGTDKWYMV
ncbi:MAG: beta strand repeat-containing protein [Candidatus Limnocylindrus sp.]